MLHFWAPGWGGKDARLSPPGSVHHFSLEFMGLSTCFTTWGWAVLGAPTDGPRTMLWGLKYGTLRPYRHTALLYM